MADDDEPLPLEPGERVLWTGRAGVGALWPPFSRLLGLLGLLVGGAATLAHVEPRGAEAAVLVVALAALPLGVIMASKLVGPYYVSLTLVTFFGGLLGLTWFRARVWEAGVDLARLAPFAVLGLVFVLLPLVRLVVGFRARHGLRFVITDRRVLATHVGVRATRLLWTHALERGPGDLRLVHSWRTPGPVLFVGFRELDGKELHLRDDDPEQVLADVQRARGAPG